MLTELIVISNKEALTTESWTFQYKMMDALMTALERSLASFTYAPQVLLTPFCSLTCHQIVAV